MQSQSQVWLKSNYFGESTQPLGPFWAFGNVLTVHLQEQKTRSFPGVCVQRCDSSLHLSSSNLPIVVQKQNETQNQKLPLQKAQRSVGLRSSTLCAEFDQKRDSLLLFCSGRRRTGEVFPHQKPDQRLSPSTCKNDHSNIINGGIITNYLISMVGFTETINHSNSKNGYITKTMDYSSVLKYRLVQV